ARNAIASSATPHALTAVDFVKSPSAHATSIQNDSNGPLLRVSARAASQNTIAVSALARTSLLTTEACRACIGNHAIDRAAHSASLSSSKSVRANASPNAAVAR